MVALGDGAGEQYGLALGDWAVSEQIVPCWKCRYCRNGQYWMCQVHDIYGFHQKTFGAFAEYMLFPAGALNYKVPKSIPSEHAAFIEPLACSIHAVQRGNIEFQDVVVIAGAGPLGLGMVAAAHMKNPRLLISVDYSDQRLETARLCGADLGLNPAKVDIVDEVLKLTDGYGCDVYIEATGHPAAVENGLRMIRKLGTFVEFSVMREPVTVDWTIIGDTKELNIHGSHLSPLLLPGGDQDARGEALADGAYRDPHPSARRVPEGHRPGRRRQAVDQGDADPLAGVAVDNRPRKASPCRSPDRRLYNAPSYSNRGLQRWRSSVPFR